MRTVAILFISLLILMTVPVHISADDPLPTNDLVVDERWVDIIQAEDRETLDVVEFIFLNNTGTDTFNGTIYSWLPDEAIVRSKCCGNAPNMACRMDEGGVMLCFDMLPTGIGNIVHGQPFEPDTFMSYFGQDATIVIEGVAQNSSYSDSLFLNVTVGQPQTFGDFPVVTGDGLHLTDNAEQLGVVATIPIDASGMAERLGLIQSINITNISPFNDTVDFEITGLPEGWTAILIDQGVVNETVVGSNESKEIILHIQVPTYKIEIQLAYAIPIEGADDSSADYLFQKDLIYPNDFIEIFAFILEDDKMTVGDNLDMIFSQWSDQYQREWYAMTGVHLSSNETISFTIGWKNEFNFGLLALIITLVVIGSLIGYMFYRKKFAREETETPEGAEDAEEDVEPPSELEQKKQTMLLAIQRLKTDFEEGKIPEDVYENLLEKYKKSAVDVMKEIDGER
jgi:hypothetical protein